MREYLVRDRDRDAVRMRGGARAREPLRYSPRQQLRRAAVRLVRVRVGVGVKHRARVRVGVG